MRILNLGWRPVLYKGHFFVPVDTSHIHWLLSTLTSPPATTASAQQQQRPLKRVPNYQSDLSTFAPFLPPG